MYVRVFLVRRCRLWEASEYADILRMVIVMCMAVRRLHREHYDWCRLQVIVKESGYESPLQHGIRERCTFGVGGGDRNRKGFGSLDDDCRRIRVVSTIE